MHRWRNIGTFYKQYVVGHFCEYFVCALYSQYFDDSRFRQDRDGRSTRRSSGGSHGSGAGVGFISMKQAKECGLLKSGRSRRYDSRRYDQWGRLKDDVRRSGSRDRDRGRGRSGDPRRGANRRLSRSRGGRRNCRNANNRDSTLSDLIL